VISPDGLTLFVTQVSVRKIRLIDIATRNVTVLMDHPMYDAMAISPDGKKLLLTSASSLSMVDIATKIVTTIAGGDTVGYEDGAGTDARFTSMFGVAFDPTGDGSWALVGDRKTVRVVDLASEDKTVTTIAGSLTENIGDAVGRGDEMRINAVYGMTVSPDGLTVYISDHVNRKIKTISLCPNKVSCSRAHSSSMIVYDCLKLWGFRDFQPLARSIACCMPSFDRAWGRRHFRQCGAVCGANFYASQPSNCTANTFPTCTACPAGLSTSQGATSLADCVVAQANGVVDSVASTVNAVNTVNTVSTLECGPGSVLTGTGCVGCPVGTFKDGTSSGTSCLPCGTNQTTLGNTTASAGGPSNPKP
jgi:hypothetical protein